MKKKTSEYHPQCCRNCGYNGHLYKECKFPIMSYGLICYRVKPNGTFEYLMVQRKDSLAFMEFVRGKYDPYDLVFINTLLSHMTKDERVLVSVKTFQELWNIVWHQTFVPRQTNEYFKDASDKFDKIKNGYYHVGVKEFINLSTLLERSVSQFFEPEWGFPKGRRYLKESDLECAIREFCEETTYNREHIKMVSHHPYEETFYGTNNVLYRHSYYIAYMESQSVDHALMNPNDLVQAREIRDVSWCSVDVVLDRIRIYNQERRSLFKQVNACVTELHKWWNPTTI